MIIFNKLSRIDIIIIIIIIIVTICYPFSISDFSSPPFEDAAILMRYSKNLAEGYGIVWNKGGPPIDGATDFLTMILISTIYYLGIPLEITVISICYLSHILLVLVIYLAIRLLFKGKYWTALLSSLYLAIGPGVVYIFSYFGTSFYALFACMSWIVAFKLIEKYKSNKYIIIFFLLGFLTALIRPEGLILVGLYLIAIIIAIGYKKSKKIIIHFMFFTIVIGMFYLWRWDYFGYPLPNPFYKKGGFELYFSSLYNSFWNAFLFLLPFLFIFFLSFFIFILDLFNSDRRIYKILLFTYIPILGYLTIWVLLSDEMNFFYRFQYPILPISLIIWPFLLKKLYKWYIDLFPDHLRFLKIKRSMKLALISIFFSLSLIYQFSLNSDISFYPDGRYDVAIYLNKFKEENYTMLVSEAGLLPLYSEWNVIDAWGLNDQWIAHNGIITESYIDLYKPEVVMFHAPFSPLVEPSFPPESASKREHEWFSMLMVIKNYVENHSYILAASFGVVQYDTHYYYISNISSDYIEIYNKIHNMDYIWYLNGEICINYVI